MLLADVHSVEEQKSTINQFAKSHDMDIVRWYTEDSQEPLLSNSQFMKLVDSLDSQDVNGICVYGSDRFVGNKEGFNLVSYLAKLADQGLHIYTILDDSGVDGLYMNDVWERYNF